ARLQRENVASMRYRRAQLLVRVMTASKEIETLATDPLLGDALRMVRPGKRSSRFWLTHSINRQRIVCTGSAILVALLAVADIFNRAAIDQYRTALVAHADAE